MNKTFRKSTPDSTASTPARPMFRPDDSHGWAERPAPFFQPALAPSVQASALAEPVIQREPDKADAQKEKEKDPIKTVAEQLADYEKFQAYMNVLKDRFRMGVWQQQPLEGRAALLGFAGSLMGIQAAAIAGNPAIRQALSDIDITKPWGSVIPYNPLDSFKYTPPEPGKPAYGLSANFTLNPYLESVRKRNPWVPGVNFGLETAYDPSRRNLSLTGGSVGLEWLDGGLKLEGKTLTELSHYPMSTTGAMPGLPPSTVMQSPPGTAPFWTAGQEDSLKFQLSLTAEVLKLLSLIGIGK